MTPRNVLINWGVWFIAEAYHLEQGDMLLFIVIRRSSHIEQLLDEGFRDIHKNRGKAYFLSSKTSEYRRSEYRGMSIDAGNYGIWGKQSMADGTVHTEVSLKHVFRVQLSFCSTTLQYSGTHKPKLNNPN